MLMGATPRLVVSVGLAGCLVLAIPPRRAAAQTAPCDAWELEYSLAASLRLSDTPLGQGDGVYAVGPGKVVLRFEDSGGQPAGHAKMVSYDMREYFVVVSRALLWTTTVTTAANTRATPDTSGFVAEGVLMGRVLSWSGPVRGYRTDGTLTCEGSMCGKFGAPPAGRSELHIGPGPVEFKSFEFARDMKTFTMPETFVAKTDVPKQTAYVALSGREVRRTCLPVTLTSTRETLAARDE